MSEPSLPGREQEIYNHYFTTAADSMGKQLEESRKKCENQAEIWNWGGWVAAILGFIVIIVGFIIVFVQKANAGWYGTLAGAITDGVSYMFFKQSNYANERVDKIQAKLDETQKILWAIKLSVVADSETQKKYHEKFIERLLSFPANEQEIIKKSSSSGRKAKK